MICLIRVLDMSVGEEGLMVDEPIGELNGPLSEVE